MDPGARLLPSLIRARLSTSAMGRRIYYYPEVDSTNRAALDLARGGEPEGTLVVTDFQVKGGPYAGGKAAYTGYQLGAKANPDFLRVAKSLFKP